MHIGIKEAYSLVNKNITLSIITPTFNRIESLKISIEKLLSQSFNDFEHIIVDNLSTDGTDKFVDRYKKNVTHPVIYIREKDTGIANAMNKGVKAASGTWVHILNSDDFFASDTCLQEIFNLEDINKFDVIACPIAILDSYTGTVRKPSIPRHEKKMNHYFFPHPGLLIKNSFYRSTEYYNENFRIISDAVFISNNLPNARYKILNKPILILALNTGVTSNFSLKRSLELLRFTLFVWKSPIRYKLKHIFLNIYGDIFMLKEALKRKLLKRNSR